MHGVGREGKGEQLSYSDNYPPPLLLWYMSKCIHAGFKSNHLKMHKGAIVTNKEFRTALQLNPKYSEEPRIL